MKSHHGITENDHGKHINANKIFKGKLMKKILLPLLFIATSMGITRLSAYCFFNKSNETITVLIYPSKKKSQIAPLFHKKAGYVLKPGRRGCWGWKDIDRKNRNKEWYWVAYKGGKKIRTVWTDKLGEGYFPIGAGIYFRGYQPSGRAIFDIYFHKERSKKMPPWEWKESPWNHRSQPWRTYKR